MRKTCCGVVCGLLCFCKSWCAERVETGLLVVLHMIVLDTVPVARGYVLDSVRRPVQPVTVLLHYATYDVHGELVFH